MALIQIIRLEALFILALLFPLVVQLIVLYLASRALWTFSGRTFGRGMWAVLALTGVPLHELSHAIAFLLTGAGVQRIVLFAPRGLPEYGGATGVVVPARKPSAFSKLVASIAPFFGCSFAAWAVLALLLPGFSPGGGPNIGPDALDAGGLGQAALSVLGAYLAGLADAFAGLDWGNWQTYLAVYLGSSLGMGAAPSAEDFKRFFPALAGLLVILLPVFAILQMAADPGGALAAARSAAGYVLVPIGAALSYATVFAVVMLLVLVALMPFRRLVRR
jgi:hypothetical protein